MKVNLTTGQWEGLRQLGLAALFFGFVAFGYNNDMNKTDIVFWLSLAGGSFGFTAFKHKVEAESTDTKGGD